jgi:hypothetical protein
VDVCSRLHSTRLARSSALRAAFTGSAGFSTRPLPRTCDRRCPGQTDRGSPLLSRAIVKARRRIGPKPIRPLISQKPGWSLLPQRRLHPPARPSNATRATSELWRGAGFGRFEVVLADRTRLQGSEGHHTPRPQAPRPPETTVFGETAAKGGSAHQPQKARPAARGARQRGQKQVHAPLHGRKRRGSGCAARMGPRSRALTGSGRACSPGDQGHAWASGSPGCVVKRSLDRQVHDRCRLSNDPSGARVRGSVADVETTHLPPGARPAERQAANLGVTSCGGLLGDDEGPIRSGRKGARLERANRLVSAREPAFTARCGIESTEGVLVSTASLP